MSKTCPSCHKDIEISNTNLGSLFTCSHCSAVYFINFDGDPEYEELEVSDQVYEQSPSSEFSGSRVLNLTSPADAASSLEIEPSFQNFETASTESSSDQQFGDIPPMNDELLPVHTSGVSTETPNTQDYNELNQSTEGSSAISTTSPVSTGNAIDEINEFANSTDVNLTGLTYRVSIQGIDSKALLQEVKEALEDARFNWDVGILLSKRKDGVIQLEQLTPVKAAIVIQRLRLSGLEFKWEEVSG